MARSRSPILRAERLASQQHAAINRRQALECEMTDGQICHCLRSGRWRRRARAVYAVAGAPRTWRQKAAVAWLSAPPGTLVSHGTAAALHGLGRPLALPHLTVPHGCSGRSPGAVVHQSRRPAEAVDRRRVDGLACTDVARTIADCASELGYAELCDLLDEAKSASRR